MSTIQELTFDPSAKTDDELWAMVRDACRGGSDTWRAYERLHSKFNVAQSRLNAKPPDDGAHRILAERERQLYEEEHDDDSMWTLGELSAAAACYATFPDAGTLGPERVPPLAWPWRAEWFKPKDRMRNLERAGALIAAEIDRLLALSRA